MRIGSYALKLERRVALTGWRAAALSVLAIVIALVLFSVIFILDGISPLLAYKEIFTFAFANQNGLPLTVYRFVFLLLCTCAFIVPARAGLWNIGMTGQFYAGALGTYAVLLAFGGKASTSAILSPVILIPLMLLGSAVCGALVGAIAGYLKGRFDINEIVITMMLNFMLLWLVSYMIKEGGPFMNPGGRGESFELPTSVYPPMLLDVPFTLFLALGLAVFLYWMFAKTRIGYEIKALGLSPPAARYAGISIFGISVLVFVMGGALAGLSGYHYFAAVPGVYKIARNYPIMGELAFYGIMCGLISRGNPLAAIPIALLFGGLSQAGKFVQGKVGFGFGADYALLGVLMITLVGFQFFYRYRIVAIKAGEETLDVGVRRSES